MPTGYVTDSDDEADYLENLNEDDSEIPGAIQSANSRVYSTWELYERMVKKTIDVEPPYQRDVVWTKNSQSSLIDSIFKNKWVPTLLFSERPATHLPDGTRIKARWVCMDGKQRLTSIKLFIEGQIPWFKKPNLPIYYEQSDPPHPSRRLLDEGQKDLFLSRGLTAAMYNQLTELQERDIFRLVQEGKPLSTGEKLQASAGPWGYYISQLTEQYMTNNANRPNGWSQRISNLKRGADYHTMAQVVLMIRDIPIRAPDPPRNLTILTLQKELDKLSKSPVPAKTKDEIRVILDIFMEISTLAPPKTQYTVELRTPEALYSPIQKGRKTMLAPVEMIWIPYMIHLYHSQLSKGKLLEMIETFKIDIRQSWFNEVKNNSQVIPWIIRWIRTFDLSRLKGKYVGWVVPRPAPDLLSQDQPKPSAVGMHQLAMKSSAVQTSNKRELPSPVPSPTDAANAQFKRPRRSGQSTTTPNSISASPNIPLSQQDPLSVASSSLSRLRTTQPTSMVASATNSHSFNAPLASATQRASSMVVGQLSTSMPHNGRQPTSTFPTRRMHPTYSQGTVYRQGALPQTVTPARTVAQYATQSIHPTANSQRPDQPLTCHQPSSSQLFNSASVSRQMSDQLLRQTLGYKKPHY